VHAPPRADAHLQEHADLPHASGRGVVEPAAHLAGGFAGRIRDFAVEVTGQRPDLVDRQRDPTTAPPRSTPADSATVWICGAFPVTAKTWGVCVGRVAV
jgi:hypothetical protein